MDSAPNEDGKSVPTDSSETSPKKANAPTGNTYLQLPKNTLVDPHSLYTPPVKIRPLKLSRKPSREARSTETESGYLEPIRLQSPSDETTIDTDYYNRIELPYSRPAVEKRSNISLTPTPTRALPKPTYYTPQPRRKPPILSPRPDKKILLKKSPSTSSSLKSSISRSTGRSDGSIKEREQFNPFREELPTESEYDCDSYSRPPSPTSITSSVSENSPVRIPSVEKQSAILLSNPDEMPPTKMNPVERRYSQRLTPTSATSVHSLRYFSPQFPRRKPPWIPYSPKQESPVTPTKKLFLNKDGTKSPRSKSPVARHLQPSPVTTPLPPSTSSIPKKNFFKERSQAILDDDDSGTEKFELQNIQHNDSRPDLLDGNMSDISSLGFPNGKTSDIARTPSICYPSDKDSHSDSSYMYENVREKKRKRRRSASSMSLRSLAASREVLNDIFKSDREENKKMKGVIGLCVAIFLGAVLFIGLHYGLYYTEVVSVIITVASTFFIALSLAFSVRSRCIAALMVPTLCTSRGRAALLTLTLAFLLNGPIKNIIENGNEVSKAMTCNAEVLSKHSEQIQTAALTSFEDYDTGKFLKNSADTCNTVMREAYTDCTVKLEKVYTDCQNAIKVVDTLCEPLKLVGLCEVIRVGGEICLLPELGDNIVEAAVVDVSEIVDDIVDKFNVDIDFVPNWHETKVNLTGDPKAIAKQISDKLEETFGTFDIITLILDRLVAFSVVYLLYQSYRYHASYVTKDRFDNFYITKEFRKLDKFRIKNRHEPLLPLKKYEKKKLIDVTSFALSNTEKGKFKIGLAPALLKVLMTGIIVLVDYGFYWLLFVMQQLYSEIDYNASGGGDLSYNIEGTGLMADFARNLYGEGTQNANTFQISSDAEKCIPQPTKPDDRIVIIIGVLHAFIILTILFQAYALRLRRWIAAYYYPDREHARTIYLYNKTLRKRRTLWSILEQTIKDNHREQREVERISFRAWLAAQNNFCRIILRNKSRACLGCASEENDSFYICDNSRCSGAYCAECLQQIGNKCTLCEDPIDVETGVNNTQN
ncbi:DC-STAMP domain-containing protein 2-like [Anneissia japonica]|uniref:DC-STAMP domain-containing protein 2-like n=1 Tax=Anneissia japonica TaxID=1529436 RepID=UPI0014259192|nr:DC-STAMP domain-containing protein 2-like [Anneissia japonica]